MYIAIVCHVHWSSVSRTMYIAVVCHVHCNSVSRTMYIAVVCQVQCTLQQCVLCHLPLTLLKLYNVHWCGTRYLSGPQADVVWRKLFLDNKTRDKLRGSYTLRENGKDEERKEQLIFGRTKEFAILFIIDYLMTETQLNMFKLIIYQDHG